MADPEPPDERAAPEPPWLEQQLSVYLRDESLWPVLGVGFAIATTLLAALLGAAIRGRSPLLLAALVIMVWASADAGWRGWRAGSRGLVIAGIGLWGAALTVVVAAIAFGWV